MAGQMTRNKIVVRKGDSDPGVYKTDIQLPLKNGDVHTVFPQEINQVGAFIVTEEVTEA